MRPRPAGDTGAVAVLVVALAAVLALVGSTVSALAAVAVARQRAAATADLAALAGAQRALQGPAEACRRAAEIAVANAATVLHCRLSGDTVEVVVEVRPPGRLGQLGAASSRARAGPGGSWQTPGP